MIPRIGSLAVALGLLAAPPALATTYHVDDDAPPGGDGLSWATAFDSIHDLPPLDDADEVRVAQGLYIPDDDSGFTLLFAVFRGGYAGFGAPDPDARDPEAYPTILSGDVNQDDTPGFGNTTDNRARVFFFGGLDAVLDGFTITGTNGVPGDPDTGNLTGDGIIRDCRFMHNSAAQGGAFRTGSSSRFTAERCVFEHNRAVFDPIDTEVGAGKGGAVAIGRGTPKFIDCRFSRNEAVMGGAVGHFFGRSGGAFFANCIFTANVARSDVHGAAGGAVFFAEFGELTFFHCLFYANEAVNGTTGAVFCANSTLYMQSCILWANRDASGRSFGAQVRPVPVHRASGLTSLTNIIEDTPPIAPGFDPVVIGAEPRFIDPLGPDGLLGTDDDDFRPAFGAPQIDAAADPASILIAFGITEDVRGLPRPVDDPATPNTIYPSFTATTDIGPYEYQEDCDGSGTVDSVEIAGATLDDCDDDGVPDLCQPFNDCNTNAINDRCEIASGAVEDCNANGVPDLCDIDLGTSLDENANDIPDECEPAVVYVDAGNTNRARRTGDSWTTAFADLQDALDAARARTAPTEIWVAAGTYTPGPPITRSFELTPALTLLGGFDGTETDAAQRDPVANPTILSGDNDQNDDPNDPATLEDNAFSVLVAPAEDTLVDGFTITRGVSRIREPSPATLVFVIEDDGEQFVFSIQFGNSGSALRTSARHNTFRDCDFVDNTVADAEGLVALPRGARPVFEACRFRENSLSGLSALVLPMAFNYGRSYAYLPGMPDDPTRLTLADSTITHNHTPGPRSSIIGLAFADILIDHSLIAANRGFDTGVSTTYQDVSDYIPGPSSLNTTTILNSAIVANDGAAVDLRQFDPDPDHHELVIRSSTIAGNDRGLVLDGVYPDIQNSILSSLIAGPVESDIPITDPGSLLRYNTIKGFDPADNNGANVVANTPPSPKLFVDPLGPDHTPKTGDESFRLAAFSNAIDSGDSGVSDATLDLDANPRRVDDPNVLDTGAGPPPPIDRGAYERQDPSTLPPAPADLNADRRIDVFDFAILAASFGSTPDDPAHDPRADLNRDGAVNIHDFAILIRAFR